MRLNVAVARVTESRLPLVYLNQVGGQDDLVFDGASFVLNSDCSLALRMPDFAEKDPNNLLLQKPDASFTEVGDVAGVASFANARGGILADFNLDGLVDLVVVNRRETAKIWRNITPDAGRWIELLLANLSSNRNAIGAWIEVRQGDKIQTREITSGGGHASGQNGWWHFGAGDAPSVDVRMIWPDGSTGPWQTVATNGFYVMSPNDAPRAWTPSDKAQ